MNSFENEIVLLTGQEGTFGTAMTKKLLQLGVKKIIGINRNETMRHISEKTIPSDKIKRYSCNIEKIDRMEKIIRVNKPTIIMLAAALKHIDYCQDNPEECFDINIYANQKLIDLAIKYGVKKVVFLSTDKATNPTTIYGVSKLAIEQYIQCVDSENTILLTTRYGNVLGSNGSVLDTWRKQAEKGEPLTITNPHMTRFFMSIEQAVNLVLYAIENGNNKDLWVYNNKACTIKDLADCISSNQIETGLRCEEKNDEALLTINELSHSKIIGNYYQVNKTIDRILCECVQPFRSDNAERLTKEEIMEMIKEV